MWLASFKQHSAVHGKVGKSATSAELRAPARGASMRPRQQRREARGLDIAGLGTVDGRWLERDLLPGVHRAVRGRAALPG